MRSALFCALVLVANAAFGQVQYGQYGNELWRPACPELAPAPIPAAPGYSQPPVAPITPPLATVWQDGWKETWSHEFRPYKPYDRCEKDRDGWYMNNCGCYQRDCQPSCHQPVYQQPVYQQPVYQQPYYQQPYQQPYYQQPCQPSYYYQPCQPRSYCYPQQRYSWW